MYKTIVAYTTKNDGYQKNGRLKVEGLMLHSTATPGIMAQEFRDRFNKQGLGKSIHGFLDDTCYVQCLPYEKKAGHCRYEGNNTHIGIELCEPKEWQTDAAYFAKVYENAVDLFAQLCRQFDLTEQDIIDHAEGHRLGIASNHGDVGHWFPLFGKNMDIFRLDVREKLEQPREEEEAERRREDIREMQAALNEAYRCGLATDGILGNKTAAAIKGHLLRYRAQKVLSKGAYVAWVQRKLIKRAYCCGKTGADGKYGKNTENAVRQLQKAAAIREDGIVGIDTVNALLEA